MPHFMVEYSENIEEALDLPRLFERLTETAVETGVFELAGIRCRALPRAQYRLADNHPDNAFLHLHLRIRAGRPLEDRKRAGQAIFAMLNDYLAPIFDSRPFMLSFEIAEIDADLNFKKSNVRDHIAARAGNGASGQEAAQ